MKFIYCLPALLFLTAFSFSQSPLKLQFTPKVQGVQFLTGDDLQNVNALKFEADYFNYYVSKLHVYHDGGQDLTFQDSVFLVKSDAFALDLGLQNITSVDSIRFGVGVPMNLNHLDISTYPEGHPLSYQTPSMHWGWSAGYLHMVVGGTADGNNDDILDTQVDAHYEVHSLGDGNYYEITVPCNAITENGEKHIYIDCNLDNWLGMTDLSTVGIAHGETGVNYNVMKNIILRPVFTTSSNASVTDKYLDAKFSYVRESGDYFRFFWEGFGETDLLEVFDLGGKLLYQKQIEGNGNTSIQLIHGSTYIIRFSEKGLLAKSIKVVVG